MENDPGSNLNESVRHWREALQTTEALRGEDIAELESHLRDSIDDFRHRGLSEEEAFLIATRRLGQLEQLESEFGKVRSPAVWLSRALWMVFGILAFSAATNLAAIASYVVLLAGNQLALGGFTLGWLGLGARGLVLVAVGLLAWGIVRFEDGRITRGITRCLEHPMILGIALTLFVLALQAAASLIPAFAIRLSSPGMLGQFFAIHQWGSAAVAVVLPLSLVIVLAKLAAVRRGKLQAHAMLWMSVAALTASLAAGCGQKNAQEPKASASGAAQTPVENAIALWIAGNEAEAVEAFMKVDWTQRPFSPGTVLSYTEREYANLPNGAREKLTQPMMADLESLKKLVARVKDAGLQAQAARDSVKAKQCFQQIRKCGDRLNRTDSLLIVQMVGKAFQKMAEKQLATLPGG